MYIWSFALTIRAVTKKQEGKGKDSKKRARENMGGPIDVEAGCSSARPDQHQKSTAAAQVLGRKRRRKFGRESIAVKEVRSFGSWVAGGGGGGIGILRSIY